MTDFVFRNMSLILCILQFIIISLAALSYTWCIAILIGSELCSEGRVGDTNYWLDSRTSYSERCDQWCGKEQKTQFIRREDLGWFNIYRRYSDFSKAEVGLSTVRHGQLRSLSSHSEFSETVARSPEVASLATALWFAPNFLVGTNTETHLSSLGKSCTYYLTKSGLISVFCFHSC